MFTAIRSLPWYPTHKTNNVFLKVVTVIALLVFLWTVASFAGCSNLTPNQVLKLDKGIYTGADIGLTTGVAAGKIPATEVPNIREALGVSKTNLDDLQVWIVANPMLASTPGATPPELTQTQAAIDVLTGYFTRYSLIAPLPSASSTAPATTQP